MQVFVCERNARGWQMVPGVRPVRLASLIRSLVLERWTGRSLPVYWEGTESDLLRQRMPERSISHALVVPARIGKTIGALRLVAAWGCTTQQCTAVILRYKPLQGELDLGSKSPELHAITLDDDTPFSRRACDLNCLQHNSGPRGVWRWFRHAKSSRLLLSPIFLTTLLQSMAADLTAQSHAGNQALAAGTQRL
jgi:hypothetical protein